jgi:hypothetical protein
MSVNDITQRNLMPINSKLVIFAFFATVLLQMTAYKFIWGIESLSRLFNIAFILICSVYALYVLTAIKFNASVLKFYIIPGLLVYVGFFINIFINVLSNVKVINQFGLLIPWAIYLLIPDLLKSNKLDVSSLWRYFNYFMLLTISLSLFEYFALFTGAITPRPIITSGGPFFSGYFSMLYALESGELHYRFYASFLEPGTLAMFLLPVIAYAFLHQKYLCLLVYLIAMYMTDSLGGLIGIFLLIPLLVYFKFRKYMLVAVILVLMTSFFIGTVYKDDLIDKYENKNNSASVREDNIFNFINNLPRLFLEHPFGLPLSVSSEKAAENPIFYGSNVTIGNAFNLGGVLSFLGYIAVLFVSLWYGVVGLFRKRLSIDEQAVITSIFCLLPFIFQRSVIWDSSLFSLLFAPFLIEFLKRTPGKF